MYVLPTFPDDAIFRIYPIGVHEFPVRIPSPTLFPKNPGIELELEDFDGLSPDLLENPFYKDVESVERREINEPSSRDRKLLDIDETCERVLIHQFCPRQVGGEANGASQAASASDHQLTRNRTNRGPMQIMTLDFYQISHEARPSTELGGHSGIW